MNYIIYNKEGNIQRSGSCPGFLFDAEAHKPDEFVIEGEANDSIQKVQFDGFDDEGQPINPRVVDKTSEEIEADKPPKPPEIPETQKPAKITNEQLQAIFNRITNLEKK